MHHTHKMADVDHIHDGAANRRGGLLRIMALCDDSIEKLTACTKLHHKVHGVPVLISTPEFHNVWLPRQMLHNLNLSLDVILVALGGKLALQYGFAGVSAASWVLGAPIGDAKLASAQFFSKLVVLLNVFKWFAQNGVWLRHRPNLRSCRFWWSWNWRLRLWPWLWLSLSGRNFLGLHQRLGLVGLDAWSMRSVYTRFWRFSLAATATHFSDQDLVVQYWNTEQKINLWGWNSKKMSVKLRGTSP